MRPIRLSSILFASALAMACGGTDGSASNDDGPGSGGAAGAGSNSPLGDVGSPVRVTSGNHVIVGVTDDGHAVYRDDGALRAVPLKENGNSVHITDDASTIEIRGSVVFVWSDVDYETGLGQLSVWTAAKGTHSVGTSLFAADSVAASPDGTKIVYTSDLSETTLDLMMATPDLSGIQTLVDDMGRGAEGTCRGQWSFTPGDRLFVAWCMEGKTGARLARYNQADNGEWVRAIIADNTQPRWSTNDNGSKVLYLDTGSYAYLFDHGDKIEVDNGVAWAMLMPDADAILYTVGDQLRRTPTDTIDPEPIVTKGFLQRTAWSPSKDYVLYSQKVTWEEGEQRDLYLTGTTEFNPNPETLVPDPSAQVARSAFTADGNYIMYLTDLTYPPNGATLNLRPVEGGDTATMPMVYDVMAFEGSKVLYTNNRSEPGTWPVTADMHVMNVATGETKLVEERVGDGKTFFLTPEGDQVLYVRSGVLQDGSVNAEDQGIFLRSLP